MKEEFYCSRFPTKDTTLSNGVICSECGTCTRCPSWHRKHPTPEQFLEEYGREYPDNGAICVVYRRPDEYGRLNKVGIIYTDYARFKRLSRSTFSKTINTCACTPFSWTKEELSCLHPMD